MKDIERSNDLCAIYVDMGTTNTRVWLMKGDEVLSRACKPVGVRDSAHDGSPARIRVALKELISTVRGQNNGLSNSSLPLCVAAAGMISSSLGLAELPHLPTPAGSRELSGATCRFEFPDISDLPFLLIPGVRSGPATVDLQSLNKVDIMRGEETLCVGLHASGMVAVPGVVLTLGSHWKAIQLDGEGRICSSITSLSGELIHAVQTQTILAGSVDRDWPARTAPDWMDAGMQEQRRSGLARTLFCVRLMELGDEGTAEERSSYLLGAFIASDLDALARRRILTVDAPVTISGHAVVAEAWTSALARISISATVLTEEDTEKAFLSGLSLILGRTGAIERMGHWIGQG
jgi:2-dehydro-3-deoxygalactonokinase